MCLKMLFVREKALTDILKRAQKEEGDLKGLSFLGLVYVPLPKRSPCDNHLPLLLLILLSIFPDVSFHTPSCFISRWYRAAAADF